MLLVFVTLVSCAVAISLSDEAPMGDDSQRLLADALARESSLRALHAARGVHRSDKRYDTQELHDAGDIDLPIWRFG